jgi:hypothetical protein
MNGDESFLLTTENIVIDGVRFDAILTSRRLILAEHKTSMGRHEEILLGDIRSVTMQENALHEPVLALILPSADGGTRSVELTFIHKPGDQKFREITGWLVKLKESGVVVPVDISPYGTPPASQGSGEKSGAAPDAQPAASPQAQDWAPVYTPYDQKANLPEEQPQKPSLPGIAAVILVIALIAGGVFIYIHSAERATTPQSGSSAPAPRTTPLGLTLSPTVTESQVPEVTPEVPSAVQNPVPASGVWVRVTSAARFTGTAGTSGRLRDIDASGDRFYQLPVLNGLIDILIAKQDGSGADLTVRVYRDGVSVAQDNTTAPYGSVELHVNLG